MPVTGYEEQQVVLSGRPARPSGLHSRAAGRCTPTTRSASECCRSSTESRTTIRRLDAPATILTESEQLYRAVGRLMDSIQVCHAYVQAVREGKIEGDAELATAIHSALNVIPTVDAAELPVAVRVARAGPADDSVPGRPHQDAAAHGRPGQRAVAVIAEVSRLQCLQPRPRCS